MSALLVIAAAFAAPQAGGPATLRSVPVEAGWSADEVTLADLDGDGRREVLVALHAKERAFERRLEAWRSKGAELERMTSLALTRQSLPHQQRTEAQIAAIRRGGYTLIDCEGVPACIVIATGSEVGIAAEAVREQALPLLIPA